MRIYARRHRVLEGDRLVLRDPAGREYLTDPIRAVGTEGVVLVGGEIIPFPDGKGCEVEREFANEADLPDLP